MLRNGYWFNLNTEEWEAKKFPPNNPFVSEADAMHYFRGEPTVFGSPVCNSEGHCYYTEVIQYNPIYDRWDSIGTISESKQFHEVVEVPREFCERIAAASTAPPTTPTGPTESTTEIVTDPYVAPDTSTVAMIIGGNWDEATRLQTMSSVELFGCPGYEERSFPLLDFPNGVYLSGATYFANNQDVGKVVACGGFLCADLAVEIETCELTERCFEWTLESGEWEETPGLNDQKWSHLMTLVQNLDNIIDVNGEPVIVDELVPMVIGQNEHTEIYNTSTREWMPYRDIPEVTEDWQSVNCLIKIGDNIYHIGNRLCELSTTSWEITDDLEVPDFLRQPGMCSQARVRDIEGTVHKSMVLQFFNHC